MIRLKGIYLDLLESKQTEAQGLNILKKADVKNPESVIQKFAEADQSKNQKNIPLMSYLYSTGYDNIDLIISTVNDYWKLEDNKKLAPYQLSKEGINIGGKTFKDFIKFSEYIHSELDKQIVQKKLSIEKDFEADAKPIWSNNGIDIYEGDSVGKCIQYTQGGLTGASYSFCIGQPGSANMYKSYRDTAESSFYFIVDKNRFRKDKDGTVNLEDPLHIVVFDNSLRGIQLTDASNTTGTIAEFGDDADAYVDYLKSKGVPVEKLVRKPKTKEEEEEEKLLGTENPDKEFFEELSYEQKSNYIGRGHTLSNKQFDILYDDKDDFLISKYVDTGLKISEYQFDKLTNKQEKTYLRKRIIGLQYTLDSLEDYEYIKLSDDQKQTYIEKAVEFRNQLSDLQYKDTPDDLKLSYIDDIFQFNTFHSEVAALSDEQYKDTPYDLKEYYIEASVTHGELLSQNQYENTSDDLKQFYFDQIEDKDMGDYIPYDYSDDYQNWLENNS